MSGQAWLITSGSYSDYEVLAAALTEEDAQQWADAYNAARESLYRDDAVVETVTLHTAGDPLPRAVVLWNADADREWSHREITADLESDFPRQTGVYSGSMRNGPIAANYPTPEAARAAWDAAKEEGR